MIADKVSQPPSGTGPRPAVLVVEDDPAITELLRDALEAEGYRVLTAVGGASLHLARASHPDVILLDLHMPGMEGIEVSRRLRSDPATAHIPIVVMSATMHVDDIIARMPIDDRLPKPFDLRDLYHVVARWTDCSCKVHKRKILSQRHRYGDTGIAPD